MRVRMAMGAWAVWALAFGAPRGPARPRRGATHRASFCDPAYRLPCGAGACRFMRFSKSRCSRFVVVAFSAAAAADAVSVAPHTRTHSQDDLHTPVGIQAMQKNTAKDGQMYD
jgi:hypothetical protein